MAAWRAVVLKLLAMAAMREGVGGGGARDEGAHMLLLPLGQVSYVQDVFMKSISLWGGGGWSPGTVVYKGSSGFAKLNLVLHPGRATTTISAAQHQLPRAW